jgi:hypothetical protein
VSDPLPPPADTPKPPKGKPDAPGLWFRRRDWTDLGMAFEERWFEFYVGEDGLTRGHLCCSLPGISHGPETLTREGDEWHGPYDALDSEASGHEMEGGSKGHARELYALAARLRAAAGGGKG